MVEVRWKEDTPCGTESNSSEHVSARAFADVAERSLEVYLTFIVPKQASTKADIHGFAEAKANLEPTTIGGEDYVASV
jgi:hypothetical protein